MRDLMKRRHAEKASPVHGYEHWSVTGTCSTIRWVCYPGTGAHCSVGAVLCQSTNPND